MPTSGRTVLRVVAIVVLLLVITPFVVTGVPAVIGAEESFVVLSGSMNAEPDPVIRAGDVVIVDAVDPANVEEGDVITFTTGDTRPITHRVVDVTERDGGTVFRTKGDANEDADPQPVVPNQVVGEVFLVLPLIGYVVDFANTLQGFILLVLLPIGLLVISEAWDLAAAAGSSEDDASGTAEQSQGTGRIATTGGADGMLTGDGGESDDSDEGPPTVTLQRAQLRWLVAGLLPTAAVAAYAAVRFQSAVATTVFYASVGLALLSGFLYWRTAGDSSKELDGSVPDEETTLQGSPTNGRTAGPASGSIAPPISGEVARRDPIVTGQLNDDPESGSRISVTVDSREDLIKMAIETGSWVVHDPDVETYFFLDDEMLFRYEDHEGSTPPVDPGAATNGIDSDDAASEWDEASDWVSFSDPDEAEPSESDTERSGPTTDELTPAIRRVDADTTADTPDATATDGSRPSDGAEAVVGASSLSSDETDRAATDGGTTGEPPSLVRTVDRLVDVPIRALGFLGYLVVEPPTMLYRLVRPNRGNESDSGSDQEVERER